MKTLRVLILEDNEDDALLLVRELKQNYMITYDRVEAVEGLVNALEQEWDVILSDYSMPQFSAPAALKVVQEKGLDVPFIIISGTVGEDVAVTAMKAGAHDFFPKGRLKLLVPAIERELSEAEQRRDRRQVESQLHQAKERFSKSFFFSPIATIIFTYKEGMVLDANPKMLELMGYTYPEVVGHSVISLGLLANPDEFIQMLQRLENEGGITDWERRYVRQTDDVRAILCSVTPIEVDGITCVLAMAQDITERKQVESELKALYNATSYLFKADNLVEAVQQVVTAVIAEFGQADCGIILVNRKDNNLVRVTRGGTYNLNINTPLRIDGTGLVPEAIRTQTMIYAPDALHHPCYIISDARTRSELVIPLVTSKGVLGVLDLQSPKLDAFSERDKRILTAFAERAAVTIEIMQLHDTLNHHAVELEERVASRTLELHRSTERVETILNNSSDAIVLVHLDGRIEQVNPAFDKLFAYDTDEVFNQPVDVLVTPEQQEHLRDVIQTVLLKGNPLRIEFQCVCKDGWQFAGDWAIAPVVGYDKNTLSLVISIRDISEQKHLEADLRHTISKAKELNEMKSRFFSMVAHDFHNPLAGILISLDLVMQYGEKMTEEKKLDRLNAAHQQAILLSTLTDDILTLSRAELAELDFQPTSIDLEHLCDQVIEQTQVIASTYRITLAVEGTPVPLWADAKLLHQAFSNLLSNAVKYSPPDTEVEMRVDFNSAAVRIQIQDHGMGIPPEDQAHLFESFYRAKNAHEIRGTGLGLVIVKRAVDAHRGKIEVESEIGEGTTFTITLPLE